MKKAMLRYQNMTNMTQLDAVASQTTTLSIQGMSCGGCVNDITSILKGLNGVSHASVDLQGGKASLDHAADWAGEPRVIAALTDAGYVARFEKTGTASTPTTSGTTAPRRQGCCCG